MPECFEVCADFVGELENFKFILESTARAVEKFLPGGVKCNDVIERRDRPFLVRIPDSNGAVYTNWD